MRPEENSADQVAVESCLLKICMSLIVIIISWGIHLNREIEVNYSHRNY